MLDSLTRKPGGQHQKLAGVDFVSPPDRSMSALRTVQFIHSPVGDHFTANPQLTLARVVPANGLTPAVLYRRDVSSWIRSCKGEERVLMLETCTVFSTHMITRLDLKKALVLSERNIFFCSFFILPSSSSFDNHLPLGNTDAKHCPTQPKLEKYRAPDRPCSAPE